MINPTVSTIKSLQFAPALFSNEAQTRILNQAIAIAEAGRQGNTQEVRELAEALEYLIANPDFAPAQTQASNKHTTRKREYPDRPITRQIIQGDCIERFEDIPPNSVDVVVADLPYSQGVSAQGQKSNLEDMTMLKLFYKALAQHIERVLTSEGEAYIFMDWRGSGFVQQAMNPYCQIRNKLIWDKISGAGNFYGFSYEEIFFITKQGYCPNKSGMNVWRQAGFSSGAIKTNPNKILYSQKPVELIEKIILNSSGRGAMVLDPFMGSGTTAVASHRLQRCFIGFEVNPDTLEKAEARIALETRET